MHRELEDQINYLNKITKKIIFRKTNDKNLNPAYEEGVVIKY